MRFFDLLSELCYLFFGGGPKNRENVHKSTVSADKFTPPNGAFQTRCANYVGNEAMKAIRIIEPGEASVLRIEEVGSPSPSEREVLIEVKAAALNRADILQRRGVYPPPAGTRKDIPGLEVAGVVLETGNGCQNFGEDDRVIALLPGEGYAEKVAVSEALVMPLPDGLTFTDGAAIPEAFLTAYDALFAQLALTLGGTLLIHAVGSGVGTAALQLAVEAGISTIGTAGSTAKLKRARELGLGLGINYRKTDFVEKIEEQIGRNGIDAILDLVGAAHWKGNISVLRTQGKMIVVGLVSGRKVECDLGLLLKKRLTIIGTALRSRSLAEKALLISRFRENILPLFDSQRLRPVLDKVYGWEDVVEAHRRMEEDLNFGKIVLTLS